MKKYYSPFSLYAYLSVVLIVVVLLTMLLIKVNTPWFLALLLVTLLRLGRMVLITSQIEMINRAFGNLKTGLPFHKIEEGEKRKLIDENLSRNKKVTLVI